MKLYSDDSCMLATRWLHDIYKICGIFTLSMLATMGQLTTLYLCNFSEFTVVFSDHFGLSVKIVEKADIKCITLMMRRFLHGWYSLLVWSGNAPKANSTTLPKFLEK